MAAKSSDWRPGPTVCRCCLTEGCYKDISTEYFWMGKREVYSEMLLETFDLTVAYAQTGGPNSNSRLICEPCISRLRDACDFKRQVVECERVFHQHLAGGSDDIEGSSETVLRSLLEKDVKQEMGTVKVEIEAKMSDDEDFGDHGASPPDDDDDDLDDQPLTKLATKVPKKETVDLMDLMDNAKPEKRKSTTKVKTTPSKKVKKKETPKPSASKAVKPPAEKKKKGEVQNQSEKEDFRGKLINWTSQQERLNRIKQASILLECSTICPFKWMKHNYMCIYCDEKFTDPESLNTHNTTHSLTYDEIEEILNKNKKYIFVKANVITVSCKLCDDAIQNLNELRVHLLKTHRKNIDLESSDGVLPFKITKSDFDCALCPARFEEYTTLNHHMNVHFPNFICEQCGTGFITPDRLRAHLFSHETGTFRCDECDKVFRSNNSKNEHFDRVHKKVKRHRCPTCGENFKNYYQRNKHVSTVHGLKLKEFRCVTCDRVFTTSGKLGIHKRMVHLKEKRYACDFCEWKFFSKTELESHMVRHGGERKYQCAVCKKAYARKYTLREHMRIHENDKRFICTLCGRAFVQNCSLKHHLRFHHPTATKKVENYDNA